MVCTIMKTILNCALLYYIVQFIFRRYYQHQGTDKFNKRHSIPVVRIVIKMKLPRRHLQCLFKDILHTLTDQLGPLDMNSNIMILETYSTTLDKVVARTEVP